MSAAPESATVLQFTGAWEGRFEASPSQRRVMEAEATEAARAMRAAQLIMDAKSGRDDWTGVLLLGLLATMDEKQRTALEISIASGPINEAMEQALALVQLVNGDKAHRERISTAIARLQILGAAL